MSKRRVKAPDLGPCEFIKVYYDSDLQEYSVTMKRNREATYYTDNRKDALGTAQAMRNEYLRNAAEMEAITTKKTRAAKLRISQLCKRPPLQQLWFLRPEFKTGRGLSCTWSDEPDWPIGAGMDAPQYLPSGSTRAYDDVVMPAEHNRYY